MDFAKLIKNTIHDTVITLYTSYLATVLQHSVNSSVASIQPLSLTQLAGQQPKKQAVISGVPVSQVVLRTLRSTADPPETLKGKTVIVACMERDISQTKKGQFALPSLRDHSMSDSVIVGFL